MRLNTPIGSSLRIHRRQDPRGRGGDSRDSRASTRIVTTVGTDEGRNYARVRRAADRRRPSERPPQNEIEKPIRERLSRMAGLSRVDQQQQPAGRRSRMLGPDSGKLTELSQELMARLAKIPGIADLESSEKGANPTIAVRINNELASDLGLTTASDRQRAAAADRRRPDQHLARPGRPGLRRERAAAEGAPRDRGRPRRPVRHAARASTRTARRCWCRCARSRSSSRPAARSRSSARTCSAASRIYANAQGRPSGDVGTDAREDRQGDAAAAGLSLRRRRRPAGDERDLQRRRWRRSASR